MITRCVVSIASNKETRSTIRLDERKMKKLTFERQFQVEKKYVPESYEHYVYETSKLINRSYIATATLVKTWPLEKIQERLEVCTKHAGTMPGDVKWWWLRKQDKTKNNETKKEV